MPQSAVPRIVITGIGVVSPFGVGRERFWSHVSRGCSGTRAITDFDASDCACRVAAPVTDVTIDDVPTLDGDEQRDQDYRADPKRYSRAALIGVIAAREAWADAGLRIGEPNAGVIIGSGGGGIDVGERQYYDFFVERGKKVTPYAIPISIVGMVSSEISISLRLHGISHVLSCGCTSSTDAIGYAAALLRAGEADVLLSGGTDACVTPGMIFGFSRMRAVSTAYNDRPAEASRPFDSRTRRLRARRGRVDDRARTRGSRAGARREDLRVDRRLRLDLRRVSPGADGPGRRGDRPRDDPRHRAIRAALDEIGYVNYHGTSTAAQRRGRSRAACGRCSVRTPTGWRGRR